MGQEEFTEQLVLAFQNPRIQSLILAIIREEQKPSVEETAGCKEEAGRLEEECQRLKQRAQDKEAELKTAGQRITELERENGELKKKLRKIEKQLNSFVSVFGKFYSMLETYDNLSEHTRNALKGIFKEEEPDSWAAAGVQPENIDSLWEYTRMQIMNRKYEDLDGLCLLIYYFLDLYNSTRSSPVYALQQVKPGDLFDVDGHIRTSDSKAAGRITRVFLYGYRNLGTDTLIKRSVVMI